MGGVGSALDPGDYYLSLDTGLLDGQCTHLVVLGSYGTAELVTTHTIFANNEEDIADNGGGLYAAAMGYVMNLESYNKLPADLQQILVECLDYAGDRIIEEDVMWVDTSMEIFKERGDTFTYITDADRVPERVCGPGGRRVGERLCRRGLGRRRGLRPPDRAV